MSHCVVLILDLESSPVGQKNFVTGLDRGSTFATFFWHECNTTLIDEKTVFGLRVVTATLLGIPLLLALFRRRCLQSIDFSLQCTVFDSISSCRGVVGRARATWLDLDRPNTGNHSAGKDDRNELHHVERL